MVQMPVKVASLDLPLIAVIVVDSDQVQKAWRTAQFRLPVSAEHIPCLELGLPVHYRVVFKIGPVVRSDNVYRRIAMQNACGRIDFSNRLAALEGSAHELAF